MESVLLLAFVVAVIGVAVLLASGGTSSPSSPKPEPVPRDTRARPAPSAAAEPPVRCTVTALSGRARVIDGDTLVVCRTQVRLFGIDAPELDHPYGQKAKWALVSLCKGQVVHAEIVARDAYDRSVARCRLGDGRDLSAEMVRLGLAIDWPKFSGGTYRALERPGARRRLWLADARQKGHMHVWRAFEARERERSRRA